MYKRLFSQNRTIIPSLDMTSISAACTVAAAVRHVPQISGFKLGAQLAGEGLAPAVSRIRFAFGGKTAFIYDHQKGGTDVKDTASGFARMVKSSGFNAVILFPFTGPLVQRDYTKACQDEGLIVIVGGMMTHDKFLRSEGGYIDDSAPSEIYSLAIETDVRHFVVPGNKVEWVEKMKSVFDDMIGEDGYDMMGPGFIAQGGNITRAAKAAGKRFHCIIGRGITGEATAGAMAKAAEAFASQLA